MLSRISIIISDIDNYIESNMLLSMMNGARKYMYNNNIATARFDPYEYIIMKQANRTIKGMRELLEIEFCKRVAIKNCWASKS